MLLKVFVRELGRGDRARLSLCEEKLSFFFFFFVWLEELVVVVGVDVVVVE